MLKSMTPIFKIIKNLASIGCVISLILSTQFTIEKEKEKAQKFITLSLIFAVLTTISIIPLKL